MAWRQAGTPVGQLLEPATARHLHQFARRRIWLAATNCFQNFFAANRAFHPGMKSKNKSCQWAVVRV